MTSERASTIVRSATGIAMRPGVRRPSTATASRSMNGTRVEDERVALDPDRPLAPLSATPRSTCVDVAR